MYTDLTQTSIFTWNIVKADRPEGMQAQVNSRQIILGKSSKKRISFPIAPKDFIQLTGGS